MASVCVECGGEKKGYMVREDAVIRGIRRVKKMLGIAKNNILVVCAECAAVRKEKRERFEKRFVQHGAVAVIVFLLFVLVPVFSGARWGVIELLTSALLAALVGGAILLLTLFGYSPAFEMPQSAEPQPQPAEAPKLRIIPAERKGKKAGKGRK